LKIYSYIFVFGFILLSCGGPKKLGSNAAVKDSKFDEPTRKTLVSLFIDGQTQKNIGNFDQAMSLFDQVLEIDPTNHAALFDQAMILERQGEFETALKKVNKASALDPTNTWYKILNGQLFLGMNNFEAAEKIYEEITAADKNNFEYNYDLASIRMRLGKFDEAIESLNAIEDEIGFSEDIIMEKQSLYLEIGKPELARKEVQKLIDQNPTEPRYYNAMASIYETEKNNEMVMKNLRKVEELDPNNGLVKLYLYDHYLEKGEEELAQKTLEETFDNEKIDIDAKMEILLRIYESSEANSPEMAQAIELAEKLKTTHPNEAKSHAISGDLLMSTGNFESARVAFKRASELDPSKIAIWNQLVALDAQLNLPKLLADDSAEALELFPMSPVFYFYNGLANNQEGEYQKAVNSLKSGKELVYNDPSLEQEFYSALGDAYHELKNYPESDKYFEKALKLNPNNTFVLNNYSYYLSIRNSQLDKAESMAALANELQPNSPSFQDTYAWVLYKNNKHEAAKEWLLKALANGGDDSGTILEHLGDVYYKLGNTEKALDYWNQAKLKQDYSDKLLEKISSKKLIE